jgi:hypothetical protein
MCELEQNDIYFQNEDVTALKIKYNPFAKAFLDKPNNNGSSSDNNNHYPLSNHQHQQQQQQQQQEFQLLDLVAPLNNSHHHHQYHSGLQKQQQQRHLPYNVQQRFHRNSGSLQLTSGKGSPPGLGGMIMKDKPSPLYTPNYWGHSSSSPGSSNTFLETSAFDSMWNRCGGNSGAYFAPPVTSSPPSNYTLFILLFLDEA